MVPPCVVLVINDNPYGLMCILRYPYRLVHRQCMNSICWVQGWIPSRLLDIMNIFEDDQERRKDKRLIKYEIQPGGNTAGGQR